MSEARALLLAIADELDKRDELLRNCGDLRMTSSSSGVSGVIRTIISRPEPELQPKEEDESPTEPDDPENYHTWPA